MSSFQNCMPSDYYQTQIVSNFTEYNKEKTDFTVPIYQRNPRINYKLSLNHIEFIEYFVRLIKPSNFLELGVQFGECINKIVDLIPKNYYAVDIDKHPNMDHFIATKPHFSFFHNSTDNFFKSLDDNNINLNLDMVFIDALHTHEASYNDFLNVRRHVKNDGIIFFHDCYPYSANDTIPELCGDVYKTPELIRKNHNDEFEILTIPIFPGISIARKCVKQLEWL